MKVGDLVRLKRGSIGIPKGTIGLIVKVTDVSHGVALRHVHFMSRVKVGKNHPRPFLPRDLQIL
jgi:hypothetical protein